MTGVGSIGTTAFGGVAIAESGSQFVFAYPLTDNPEKTLAFYVVL